jgi:hypothetical protein
MWWKIDGAITSDTLRGSTRLSETTHGKGLTII